MTSTTSSSIILWLTALDVLTLYLLRRRGRVDESFKRYKRLLARVLRN